jgi:hypothetical protein
MDTSARVPGFWNQFAENMYLKDLSTAEVRLSERSMFRFGRFQSNEGLPEITRGSGAPSDYLIALQLKAIPFIEQFLGTEKVSSGSYPIGGVSVLNLQEKPAILLPNSFDTLVLHVTQSALDEIAYAHKAPRVEKLVWPFGHLDPVVYHLGQTLVFTRSTQSHIEGFPGPCFARLELSFCLLVWWSEDIGPALSRWAFSATDAKSDRVPGGASGRQYQPRSGCKSMRLIGKSLCSGLQAKLSQAALQVVD